MSELRTFEEYKAEAKQLIFPNANFIDGGFRKAVSGKTMPSVNPATGETLVDIPASDIEDVNFAVQKAREAFDDGRWAAKHPAERKEILIRLAKLMVRNRLELALLESLDSGKTMTL